MFSAAVASKKPMERPSSSRPGSRLGFVRLVLNLQLNAADASPFRSWAIAYPKAYAAPAIDVVKSTEAFHLERLMFNVNRLKYALGPLTRMGGLMKGLFQWESVPHTLTAMAAWYYICFLMSASIPSTPTRALRR